ncbi:MAG: diacylglycerol kinase family protein [Paracoccaceae bacterium]|jgi:diacylglycerol kinase family enzyme|nr:diacylglycerol kinase family protein [Paracoccaceae bacterium]
MGQRPDICVLVNPGAGRDAPEQKRAWLEAACARHPGRFALREIARGTPLSEQVRQVADDGFARIAAAGGDGTVAGVAAALAEMDDAPELAVIPFGTFNYFARGIGLPLETGAAADLAAGGGAHAVAAGEVNGQLFLNNASLGLYPEVLRRRERIYAQYGRSRPAALWSVARTILRAGGPEEMRVTLDGRTVRQRSPLVFVARSAFQVERFGLPGAECIRDGRFGVFVAPDGSRAELFTLAARLAAGRVEPGRDFDWHCAEAVTIDTRRRRRTVACDGERFDMAAPFRFALRRDALRVVRPEGAERHGDEAGPLRPGPGAAPGAGSDLAAGGA